MTDTQEAMREEMNSFDGFLNEPPSNESELTVREYRHLAFPKWNVVVGAIQAATAQSAEKMARLEAEKAEQDNLYNKLCYRNEELHKQLAAAELSNKQLRAEIIETKSLLTASMVEHRPYEEYHNEIVRLNDALAQQPSTEALDAYVAGKVAGMQTVRYMRPNSQKWDSAQWAAFGAMADECRSSNLYKDGDAILVWVNEGDILRVGKLMPLPPAPEKE